MGRTFSCLTCLSAPAILGARCVKSPIKSKRATLRLIEYDLPLAVISEASAREKSVWHGLLYFAYVVSATVAGCFLRQSP
jgi:hypothetical protein